MKYYETSAEFVKCLPFRKRHLFDFATKPKNEQVISDACSTSTTTTSASTIPSPPVKKEEEVSTVIHPKPAVLETEQRMRKSEKIQKRKITEISNQAKSDDEDEQEENEKIYCVCRQKYNPNLWMIACDACNEWFHGKCVGITAVMAKKIKVYVCPNCKSRDNGTPSTIDPERQQQKRQKIQHSTNNAQQIVSILPLPGTRGFQYP